MDNKTNIKQNTETGTLKKPTEMLNTGSNIRTSTVLKGPHPELGMSGGRKPGAYASATGASAPKTVVRIAKALGPPAGANKCTYAEGRTDGQTLRSHARSNIATPSPEWLKKNELGRCFLTTGRICPPKKGLRRKGCDP